MVFNCVNKLKVYFHADKWQINQPIILADVVSELLSVEGVASVVKPQAGRDELIIVTNKWGSAQGYSNNIYDIKSATHNGVVYPSVDPAIFELKYPDSDIQGRVLGDI